MQAYQTQFAEYRTRDDDGEQKRPDQELCYFRAVGVALVLIICLGAWGE